MIRKGGGQLMDFLWFHGAFSFASIFISIVFVLVFGTFIFVAIKGITTWSKNNQSPILTVPAEVVSKRTKTSGGRSNSSASTWYYVTFQVQSGDRIELGINGSEFGLLAEKDLGMLTFQGSRYKGFERKR